MFINCENNQENKANTFPPEKLQNSYTGFVFLNKKIMYMHLEYYSTFKIKIQYKISFG